MLTRDGVELQPFYGTSFVRGTAASPAADLSELAGSLDASGIGFFIDQNVPRAWLHDVSTSTPSFVQVVDGGERNKSLKSITRLIDDNQTRLDKTSLAVIIGGGATLDLVGLFCGLLYRGIRFISVPTSMMAMADAAYGGKTAVNYGAKNQIGIYHRPQYVYVNPVFLQTLDEIHVRSGLVEIAKLAVFFADIRTSLTDVIAMAMPAREAPAQFGDLATLAARRKLELLDRDPYEEREASVMVYGHPFANAFEAFAQERHLEPLPHGVAVALGICFSAWLAEALGSGLPPYEDQLALMSSCVDPLVYALVYTPGSSDLGRLLRHDKYVAGDVIRLPAADASEGPRYALVPLETVEREYARWRDRMLGGIDGTALPPSTSDSGH